MKRRLLVAAMAALTSIGAFAQGYYAIKKTGTTSEYNMNATATGTPITGITGGVSNTLSAAQTLPFAWNFYGAPVTTFLASSSGYITFDATQTVDNISNVALPSTSAPKNAIFAFWDNLKLEPVTQGTTTFASDVRTWTYGTAPSQVFVIQWRLAGTIGASAGSNVTYFAIRIYQGGGFDIVENYGFGSFAATVGCQNAAGTVGTNVGSSPAMPFGGNNGSYLAASSDVYQFIYGTQPALSVIGIANKTASIASTSVTAGTPIAIQYTNNGSATVTGATLNYTINGGATQSEVLTASIGGNGGLAVLSSVTKNFKPVAADEGTTKAMVAWLTNINSTTATSDTMTFNIFVNKGISGTKRVILEEASGAWCGYCVDGHLKMRDILAANGDKVIGVVHHNADGMANTESNTLNTAYVTGFPMGFIDRTLFDDQTTVGLNRGTWVAEVAKSLLSTTPVNVSIPTKSYDATTGAISFTVKADFVDYALPGDLRFNAFIVEDKVRGTMISATSTTWNQHNYYSSADAGAGGSTHELYNEPAYFYGYFHNHVVRSIPSTAWGSAGIISGTPAAGSSYSKTYNYTLPASVSMNASTDYAGHTGLGTNFQSTATGLAQNKPNEIILVGFVSYYNADLNKRQILNVIEVPLTHAVGIAEKAKSNTSISSVTPNPTSGFTSVDFNVTSKSNVTVELLNVIGQKVLSVANGLYAEGDHTVAFDASTLNKGVYFVNVKTDEGSATHKIVVSGN
ncbi:MAG: T9SS type A sorting domain-containing protein [Bacteroidota bacterium]